MVAELRPTTSDLHHPAGAAATVVLTVLVSLAAVVWTPTPAAAAVPPGFTEVVAFDGLESPTAVRFAPDGRVFVAEKRGTIQMFDGLDDATATTVADLRTEVHDFWDRGLLGLAVDPAFPGRPYLYAMYTFDGAIGGTAPRWGTAGADSDPCPSPPGASTDGCVVSSKLVKLAIDLTAPSAETTSRQDLVNDWCQQYPSHSAGDLVFGPDGALYASGGDGAGFDFVDYGQNGDPPNPCGDPTGGGAMTPPSAEGGALRAQDLRTPGDPVGLDGTVIRVSPDTGLPLPDNPAAGAADVNAQRIVAHGLRNPFRMTARPGTGELWIGDTGWADWEEVNRLVDPTAGVADFGWPCVEGDDRQPGYDAADLQVCEDLYAQGDADTKAFHRYRHGQPLDEADDCQVTSGASTSGLAFQREAGTAYPAEYDRALFLADYSRSCIWVMPEGADGLPDAAAARPFVTGAASPVDLEISPEGELFYADIAGGTVRRVRHVGPDSTGCPAGQYLAEYYPNATLSGAPASRACEPPPLDHDWGSGAPVGVGPDDFSARWTGTFDFPSAGTYTFTAAADGGIRVAVDGDVLIDQWPAQPTATATLTASRALAQGPHQVAVEWSDAGGAAVAGLAWSADSSPRPVISGPESGTTWAVGDTIAFSGSATDPEDGALPESSLSWRVVLQHCPDACHAHELQTFPGVAGGALSAPDHEYPAHLELQLTATDRNGLSATVTRRLDPRTVALSVASQPAGLQLALGSQTATAPFTRTLIVGSTASLSAPTPQTSTGTTHQFTGWSDGGAQSHTITTGATDATYTATYTAVPGV